MKMQLSRIVRFCMLRVWLLRYLIYDTDEKMRRRDVPYCQQD